MGRARVVLNGERQAEFEDVPLDDTASPAALQRVADTVFCAAFSTALQALKREGAFRADCFAQDVLLGLQFFDPGASEADLIEAVSERSNSEAWHRQMQRFCRDLREHGGRRTPRGAR